MSKNKGFTFLNPNSEEGKECFKIIKEYLECYSDKFWKEYFDKKERKKK